jgi:acetaldehyde dehydrogenase/alcohol dehydrogenase
MPSPHQRAFVANEKYATVADLLGLGGESVGEKVNNLIAAVEDLLDRLAIPRSIADLSISKEAFRQAVPDLAALAFDDPSWRPTNPRMPLMSELPDLLWKAYEGRGQRRSAEVEEYSLAQH